MGPRSIDRGIETGAAVRKGAEMLQWGRDLSIAEFPSPVSGVLEQMELQWGRDLSIAEFFEVRIEPLFIDEASMGPRSIDRGIASGARFAVMRWTASMGPRSIDRGIATFSHATLQHSSLQWGRDLSIAEFRGQARPKNPPTRASMGPRSIDRGIHVLGYTAEEVDRLLQWGRDLSIAELSSSSATSSKT